MGKKYIDVETLKDIIGHITWYRVGNKELLIGAKHDEEAVYKYTDIKQAIKNAPTADVAPVIHAKWSKHCWEEHNYHCSNCNNLASKGAYGYNNDLTPYCPNCGAIMDGGNE